MRPFRRPLKLENRFRNKEMASYFAKMTFFKNQQDYFRVLRKCYFLKIRGHFYISAPIFKFKGSTERSYQCGFITVILLKIDAAVLEILIFRTKHVFSFFSKRAHLIIFVFSLNLYID